MAFEAEYVQRRHTLAQFGRDGHAITGFHPLDFGTSLDPSRGILPPGDSHPASSLSTGFACISPGDITPAVAESANHLRGLQPRGTLFDEMLKMSLRKLNVSTRTNSFDFPRVEDPIDEDVGEVVWSPRHFEDNPCFSPRMAASRVRGSSFSPMRGSPTSVLSGSGDAWNLQCETTGRMHLVSADLQNSDMLNHPMDRSGYLAARQVVSPRSSPLSSPFSPSKGSSFHAGAGVPYVQERGFPNPYGMNSEVAPNWAHGTLPPVFQGRHPASKLAPPGLVHHDRGFHPLPVPHSNPRTPMRAVFVAERPGRVRESSGTGVFLPRCVGSDFNRKPACSPVLLPIWNESDGSIPGMQMPADCNVDYSRKEVPPLHSQQPPSQIPPGTVELGSSPACKIGSRTSEDSNVVSSASQTWEHSHHHQDGSSVPSEATENDLEGLELPPEWVY